MKILFFIIFTLSIKTSDENHECALGVRTYPFKYIGAT